MEKINEYKIAFLGIFVLSLVAFSCNKLENYSVESATLDRPTLGVTVSSAVDSALVLSAVSTMDGYITIAILDGDDDSDYDNDDILTGNITNLSLITNKATANNSIQFSFSGLTQNTAYRILAVASNSEGNTGNQADMTIDTDDTYPPELTGNTPEISLEPTVAIGQVVTLSFNENVRLGDVSKIQFGYYNQSLGEIEWENVPEDSITVSGKSMTIIQPILPDNGVYCFVNIEDGAILDIIGNSYAGDSSGIDGSGNYYGIYFRTVKDFVLITEVSPDTAVLQDDPTFEVTVTFDTEISGLYNFSEDVTSDNNINFYYQSLDGSLKTVSVISDSINFSGTTVTIKQPYVPSDGDMIYVKIAEGVFSDINGNPTEAYEMEVGESSGWLIP